VRVPIRLSVAVGLAVTAASVLPATTASDVLPVAAAQANVNLSAVHVSFHRVVSGLSGPVFVATANDGSGRLFIVQQNGIVRVAKHGRLLAKPYLDISNRVATAYDEQGLLSIAFHPGFSKHPSVYVAYTRSSDNALQVSRFRASSAKATSVPASSERRIISVPHPQQLNHNGGQLLFDSKGRLLITTGDGGGGGDPFDNARNLHRLNGKILRINIDRRCSGRQYCIPKANPFAHAKNANKRAIFDFGLRNPWRVSFDRSDGSLWIADVGQDAWEEIDHVRERGGKDFGWSCREGRASYNSGRCTLGGKPRHMTGPVQVYSHGSGRCAVIGGYAYHGSAYRFARGLYVYADYCGGQVYGLAPRSGGGYRNAQIGSLSNPTGFGQSPSGELYVVTGGGDLFHVVFRRV
jgi:glucose/arabinose dehydrogenase